MERGRGEEGEGGEGEAGKRAGDDGTCKEYVLRGSELTCGNLVLQARPEVGRDAAPLPGPPAELEALRRAPQFLETHPQRATGEADGRVEIR